MSVKIEHHLVDDLELHKNPEAEVPADKTVQFAVSGELYEIDLTDEHERQFRKKLEPYMRAGRKLRGKTRPRPAALRQRSTDIRQWARDHGFTVSERGRIPASLIERYEAAARAG